MAFGRPQIGPVKDNTVTASTDEHKARKIVQKKQIPLSERGLGGIRRKTSQNVGSCCLCFSKARCQNVYALPVYYDYYWKFQSFCHA